MANGATILGCEGASLGADEAAFFRDADPWGFILFTRNVEDPDQVRRLTGALRAAVGRDAPVFIDQEGGRVQRLRPPHWRQWQPPLDQMARGGLRALALRYRLIAAELRAVGIDGNCAPCADIAGEATHPFLRNRCYGSNLEDVVNASREVATALLSGGVLPVVKHMPGHGRAEADSHLNLPKVTADAATLRATDFAAFRALADLPLAMTAHIVFEALDPDHPATASARMIRLIREEIGFAGLLMTDDLNMEALSGTLAERTAAAIAAGCDAALHCSGKRREMEPVVAAAGRMGAAAQARAEAALRWRKTPETVDIAALEAEFEALSNGQGHG